MKPFRIDQAVPSFSVGDAIGNHALALREALRRRGVTSEFFGRSRHPDLLHVSRPFDQVYWGHRVWPTENPGPKPHLSSVMPESVIRAKVADYLKKSNALATMWQRPIIADQLQAELDRMASQTRAPDVLQELFAAPGNDPLVIAETLARQTLADRLIRNWYAYDDRFHGETKARAQAALLTCTSVACLNGLASTHRETTWRLRGDAGEGEAEPTNPEDRAVVLDADEWSAHRARLARKVGGTADALSLNTLGSLRGDRGGLRGHGGSCGGGERGHDRGDDVGEGSLRQMVGRGKRDPRGDDRRGGGGIHAGSVDSEQLHAGHVDGDALRGAGTGRRPHGRMDGNGDDRLGRESRDEHRGAVVGLDPKTNERYQASLQRYYEYLFSGFEHRQQVFEWQLLSSKIIFAVVLVLVLSGIYFAAVQFHVAQREKAKGEPTQLEASLSGIKVSSSVLGVIILVISLLFFYLYLVHVYPISEVF